MAAIEQFESRGYSIGFGGETLYRNYIVDSSGDPQVASADPGLPVWGSVYGDLIAINIDIYRYNVDTCWAIVTYAQAMAEEECDIGTEGITVTNDLNGNPIGPFYSKDPVGVTVDRPRTRLVVHRWRVGAAQEKKLQAMAGKVNEETWRGWPKKFWKFGGATIQYSPPALYRICYTFDLMPIEKAPDTDGWGPGWQYTWYNRDKYNGSITGDPNTVDVFKTTDFNWLNLDIP